VNDREEEGHEENRRQKQKVQVKKKKNGREASLIAGGTTFRRMGERKNWGEKSKGNRSLG